MVIVQLTFSAVLQNGQTATDGLYQGPTALSQGTPLTSLICLRHRPGLQGIPNALQKCGSACA